jgi:hypothetical protein
MGINENMIWVNTKLILLQELKILTLLKVDGFINYFLINYQLRDARTRRFITAFTTARHRSLY